MTPEERAEDTVARGEFDDVLPGAVRYMEAAIAEAIRAAENEAREACAKIADHWAAKYPTDIFPEEGTSLDAKAAGHGRHVAKCIAEDIRRHPEGK